MGTEYRESGATRLPPRRSPIARDDGSPGRMVGAGLYVRPNWVGQDAGRIGTCPVTHGALLR